MEDRAPAVSVGRKRVLLADDDDAVCSLLEAALSPHCDVVAVPDAETALARLSGGARFDAIISDCMLPGISGLAFVEMIRDSESTTRVPILMISGHGAFGVGSAARAAGADAFLDKPFTLAQVRAAIVALLGGRFNFA
ncbi:MAG: hypothetical protein NVSMB21_22230 [Vulcanimicrobiaceae bacterium]